MTTQSKPSAAASDDSPQPIPFAAIGRLPLPGDNMAIATQTLAAGTMIALGDACFTLDYTVLVGHRFALRPVAIDEPLLSWGTPFGVATAPIAAGHCVCNDGMLEALQSRAFDPALGYTFPSQPNFRDRIVPYEVDEAAFQPGVPTPRYAQERTFLGHRRSAARGVGTRNMIVILGTTSSTASYARALAQRLQPTHTHHANTSNSPSAPGLSQVNLATPTQENGRPNLDGIVPVAHTEGGGYAQINNRDFLLRTLAGLMVHPNVAAVLAVDLASDAVNNQLLQAYMRAHGYPLDDVLHHFLSLTGQWQADLDAGAHVVEEWLPQVCAMSRTPQSLAHLSIALQCGGSDAFSGVSGNPLASSVAKEVIGYGGRANLAETDELIGSEAYALQNVRDLETARTFLNYIAEFKERLEWHGQSAEGNPSGGNKLRGLYNIALKSIGAAMKRHPDVRLDWVVDYAQRMTEPGYYFMNTPGNDLESIAGQVAGGSNLIIFITGNGSITNFPFVPTIKVMTTTQRYNLLSREMDVNAGAYLDGVSMDDLTQETLELLINIASGQPSKGELAGHSQISIWRNWQQQDRSRLPAILEREKPNGQPLAKIGETDAAGGNGILHASPLPLPHPLVPNIGLILPTSLCSGQIARLAVARLNAMAWPEPPPFARFATLVHTEGCGVAFASTREIYAQTMMGYAVHPLVKVCLFLEHGCEKAHNDYLRSLLRERGLSAADFGWASVQLDGGIEKVIEKIGAIFQAESFASAPVSQAKRRLSVALLAEGELPDNVAGALATVAGWAVQAGGTAVLTHLGALTSSGSFRQVLGVQKELRPTLAYGQPVEVAGLHIMETPTPHWSETLTGLAATGADIVLAYTDKPRAGHPLVPVLMMGHGQAAGAFDLQLDGAPMQWPQQIVEMMGALVSGAKQPMTLVQHNVDFQLTRGWLGIST